VCIPIVDWHTASEKSYPESEDRADNVPRQGNLNHEGILCNSAGSLASPPAASENSLLNQNIFFYLSLYTNGKKQKKKPTSLLRTVQVRYRRRLFIHIRSPKN
jgi:hypothetical protein